MSALLRTRTTLIWLLLVVATALSWALGRVVGVSNVHLAGVAVILISFIKVRLVIFEFMEIRGAPAWMRRVGDGWLVVITGLLIALFLIPA